LLKNKSKPHPVRILEPYTKNIALNRQKLSFVDMAPMVRMACVKASLAAVDA
jgi:hypothetical protein